MVDKSHALQDQLTELRYVEADYNKKMARVEKLRHVVKTIHQLDEIRGSLPSNQQQIIEAYERITTVIPYGVWLDEMQFSTPGVITLSGKALSDQNILDFIRMLNASDEFIKVSLKTMQASMEDADSPVGEPVKMFILQCTIEDALSTEEETV